MNHVEMDACKVKSESEHIFGFKKIAKLLIFFQKLK